MSPMNREGHYRLEISDLALRSAGFRTPDAAAGGREFDSLASLRAKLDDARAARVGLERQRGTSGRGPRAIFSGARSKPIDKLPARGRSDPLVFPLIGARCVRQRCTQCPKGAYL